MEGIERCDECARYPTDDAAADAHASACRCGLEVAIAPEVLAELLGAVGLVADVRTLPWYEGGPSSARTVAYRPLPRARFFAGVSIEELQPGGCDAVNGEKVAAEGPGATVVVRRGPGTTSRGYATLGRALRALGILGTVPVRARRARAR